ncbi:MAG: hypothetical protein PHV98_06840, partial [Candidatus Omnitrophica bacterium]|nr:hypothetical protein [Candidatus Omnitrophota bacterium]
EVAGQTLWFKPPEEEEELLSVAEAKSLGVPYGTTKKEAAAMGLTPGADRGIAEAIADMSVQLRSVAQDGLVSQEDYDRAKEAWQGEGLSSNDFDKEFSYLLKDTTRTRSDTQIKEKIENDYRAGKTKEDIAIEIDGGKETSQADKDRAKELLDEMISDELNEYLEKVRSEPDKYKIKDDGIYEVKKWWPDKKVYEF